MKTYARIENGVVVELLATDGDITKMFHPAMIWVDVSSIAGITEGWLRSGAGFEPPPPLSKTEIAARMWNVVKVDRDRRTEQSGFQVGGKWYHSDAKSKLQHLGNKDTARDQLAAGGTMADALLDPFTEQPIQWKTMDGSWQPLTVQLAFDIAAAGKAAELAHHAAAERHRAAMEAAANPAAYDYATGWPPAFVREVLP